MKISEEGLEFIKENHLFRCIPYKNSKDEKYLSIGYGHYGKDVRRDMVVTAEEAERLLEEDLHRYEGRVAKYNVDYHFTQQQFDALVSFAYDVGDIDELTNYGRRTIDQVALIMPLYCKFCGSISKTIMLIRKKEKDIILKNKRS